MVYLDYSATTKTDNLVLKRFIEAENKYFANPNSDHFLGEEAKEEINKSIKEICSLFKIKENELIFTSGASESNNTVLKGVSKSHVITTKLEHSSVTTPLGFLQTKGVKVSFVKLDSNGQVDLDDLKSLITGDETLISIAAVNSETGIKQDIEKIGKLLKNYPNVVFHSDITQLVGKENINLENVDLASFSMHKIFGFKGIGGLIKKEHIKIVPLIHGGKSVSVYRSGTPQTSLILSSEVALKEAFNKLDEKIKYVKDLNDYLKDQIKDFVLINSNNCSIPNILNFSLKDRDSDDALEFFSKNDIFISTKTACSSGGYSLIINELYKDMDRAENSLRISISYKTKKEELDLFVKKLKEFLNENN